MVHKEMTIFFLLDQTLVQFSSVQSLSRVRLFATPWIAACQASLSITISWSSLILTSIESVRPSSHLILCRPLLLLPPIPPSIRVFSNESVLCIRWPTYWSMASVCLSSDALLQHLPSYLGFSYLGHGESLHGCSSKAQLLTPWKKSYDQTK